MPILIYEDILEDNGMGSSLPTKTEICQLGFTYLGMPSCVVTARSDIDTLTLGYPYLGMPFGTVNDAAFLITSFAGVPVANIAKIAGVEIANVAKVAGVAIT